MKINKSLNIDLNIISPQKHIRIHEGDVDSVDILISVTVDDESVDLSGVTIKYDATINNYLAEQDADGSVVDDKISIPVTQNMTAMSGLLLIDVRMIQSDQILFTQTICATVEKAVVNGSTYIDFEKVTIIQRMNALEEKMDYIEELVENFDTSKLIVSVNRPPEGAPVEVDVDLLRVGDTWILSGDNIVYKLVETQYNYQPYPSAEPYHRFTWRPLNEHYGVGNSDPPTSVTYQAVIYTINEVQWSWLPVPEYFKGDHYLMLVDDEPTYYICVSGNMGDTGVCTYRWREEGGAGDVSNKMDLAPLDPTAQEIEGMPSGQFYSDTTNHKGIIKGGQEFYDTSVAVRVFENNDGQSPPLQTISDNAVYNRGDMWINLSYQGSERVCTALYICKSVWMPSNFNWQYRWLCLYGANSEYYKVFRSTEQPPAYVEDSNYCKVGDFWAYYNSLTSDTDLILRLSQLVYKGWDSIRQAYLCIWQAISPYVKELSSLPQSTGTLQQRDYSTTTKREYSYPQYQSGDIIFVNNTTKYKCNVSIHLLNYTYTFERIPSNADTYTKTEIDSMIPTVPTNISAFTNDSGYLTLGTLPIYDGTVI